MRRQRLVFAFTILLSISLLAGCGRTLPSATVQTTTHLSFGPTTSTTQPYTGPPTTTTTLPPRISGFLAESASFVTSDDGFVLGDVGCLTGACLAIRQTSDRGVSWNSDPAPPAALGVSEYSEPEMHFADALDGWAYGATLWSTHDGAQNWHEVAIGGTVVAMASGDGEAYALVEQCMSSSSCEATGHLYRSPADQDSWTEVPGVVGQFTSGQDSLVVEGGTIFVMAAYPGPELLRSSDGVHFAPLTVPCVSGSTDGVGPFLPGALAASDPDDVAMVCLGGPGAGSQYKEAFISHDGGLSFQRLPDPAQVGLGAELAMPSPTTLLLGTSSANTEVIRMTAPDTGWSTDTGFADGGIGLSDLAFVDPAHGVFIHGPVTLWLGLLSQPDPPSDLGQLYLTGSAGSTWAPVRIPA